MAKENRGPEVEAVAILFLTLAWIFVILRCYVRTILMKSFGTDDWLAIVALVSNFSTILHLDFLFIKSWETSVQDSKMGFSLPDDYVKRKADGPSRPLNLLKVLIVNFK